MAFETIKIPIWTRPPITPWRPPLTLTPIYSGGENDGVYTGGEQTETGTETDTAASSTVETNTSSTTFLQAEKPVAGDFVIFTGKVNYWYFDSDLKNKFEVPGHPSGDFTRGPGAYAGVYQGKFSAFVDSKGVKRVKAFFVKIVMPYNGAGQLVDTEHLLWVIGDSQYGKTAENQFELSNNGYGNTPNNPSNPGNTGDGSGYGQTGNNGTNNTGTNMKWVIIIGIIFLWLITKK